MNMENQIIQVNIDDIIPNRFQPRLSFDDEGLKELAASIKEHGIIQPLVLRKLGSKYEIIAGERRYKASQIAGLTTVPAVISNIDDNKSAEVALVENIQRRDLTPIEEAKSYKNLLDKGYLTQEQLAQKMGISQSAIANKLRLLNLDDEVQQALLENRISERHARALLTLDSKSAQKEWLHRIIADRMTVRQLDQELKKLHQNNPNDKEIPLVDINPNVEQIKDNAVDINKESNRNVANMMISEDVLTDFSNDLSQVQPSSLQMNTKPDLMQPMAQETSPVNIDDIGSVNKFFNTLEAAPANINNFSAFSPENTFTIDSTTPNLTGLDFPTSTLNDNLTSYQEVPAKEVEIFDPNPINTDIPLTNDFQNIDLSAPITELNPNNKFFTPEPIKYNEPEVNNFAPQEDIFDPMSLASSFNPITTQFTPEVTNAREKIKDLITSLQNQGVKISYTENDGMLSYQITINIDK